jgi:peptidoglycan DL-endopeptidase CwlO
LASWDAEQLANARMIVAVGLEMKMPSKDILTALVAAMQESSLRNLTGGDRDSAGLFQQRPSMGWGTYAQVTNPLYATRKFYTTLQGVKNRGGMTTWQAAQAVQRSANPLAYARWEDDARRLMGDAGAKVDLPFPVQKPFMPMELDGYLAGTQSTEGQTPGLATQTAPGSAASTAEIQAPEQQPTVDEKTLKRFAATNSLVSGIRQKLITSAQSSLGKPYVWGGSGPDSFDCSGLIYYWYNRLGVKMPRIAFQQAATGQRTDIKNLVPGDFVGFGSDVHHIAIYLGNNQILEAPHHGVPVRIRTLGKGEDDFGVHLNLPGGSGSSGAPSGDLSDLLSEGGPVLSFPGLM